MTIQRLIFHNNHDHKDFKFLSKSGDDYVVVSPGQQVAVVFNTDDFEPREVLLWLNRVGRDYGDDFLLRDRVNCEYHIQSLEDDELEEQLHSHERRIIGPEKAKHIDITTTTTDTSELPAAFSEPTVEYLSSRPLQFLYIQPQRRGVNPIGVYFDPALIDAESLIRFMTRDNGTKDYQTTHGEIRYIVQSAPEGKVLLERGKGYDILEGMSQSQKKSFKRVKTQKMLVDERYHSEQTRRSEKQKSDLKDILVELQKNSEYTEHGLVQQQRSGDIPLWFINPEHVFKDKKSDEAKQHQAIMRQLIKSQRKRGKISKYETYEIKYKGKKIHVRVSSSLVKTLRKHASDYEGDARYAFRVLGSYVGGGAVGKVFRNHVRYVQDARGVYQQKEVKREIPKVIKVEKRVMHKEFAEWLVRLTRAIDITEDAQGNTRGAILWNDVAYTVGQFFEGKPGETFDDNDLPLHSFIQGKAYTDRDKITLAYDITRAVAHLHLKGIVHRNIKGANMIIDDTAGNAAVYLIDYGLSARKQTRALQDYAGSKVYAAPEVFDELGVTEKSDVYALGIQLLAMITGDVGCRFRLDESGVIIRWSPRADDIEALLADGEPPAIHNEEVRKLIAEHLAKMLDSDPEKRISSRDATRVLSQLLKYMGKLYEESHEEQLQTKEYLRRGDKLPAVESPSESGDESGSDIEELRESVYEDVMQDMHDDTIKSQKPRPKRLIIPTAAKDNPYFVCYYDEKMIKPKDLVELVVRSNPDYFKGNTTFSYYVTDDVDGVYAIADADMKKYTAEEKETSFDDFGYFREIKAHADLNLEGLEQAGSYRVSKRMLKQAKAEPKKVKKAKAQKKQARKPVKKTLASRVAKKGVSTLKAILRSGKSFKRLSLQKLYGKSLSEKGYAGSNAVIVMIDPKFIRPQSDYYKSAEDKRQIEKYNGIMDNLLRKYQDDLVISRHTIHTIQDPDDPTKSIRVMLTDSLIKADRRSSKELTDETAHSFRVIGETLGAGAYGEVSKSTVKWVPDGNGHFKQQQAKHAKIVKKQKRKKSQSLKSWFSLLIHEHTYSEKLGHKTRQLVVWNDVVYSISEYFAGEQFAKHRTHATSRDYTARDFVAMFRDMAQELQRIHAHEVIHKDIKGPNIIVNPEAGQVKFCDFGLAAEEGTRHAQAKAGSPYFMAPEVHAENTITSKADVYSLGVTIWSTLAHRNLGYWKRPCTPKQLNITRTIEASIGDVDTRREISDILLGMLQFDPSQRLTADEVSQKFADLLAKMDQRYEQCERKDLVAEFARSLYQDPQPSVDVKKPVEARQRHDGDSEAPPGESSIPTK